MGFIKSAGDFFDDFKKRIRNKIEPEERAVGKDLFEKQKREVIHLIETHIVSIELRSHVQPSQLLPVNVHSSFYGFLGLNVGADPVGEILEITERKMTYKVKKSRFRDGISVDVVFPDLKDYRTKSLELPWEGGLNLPEAVEKGFSGLAYYIKVNLSSLAKSRSKEGLQSKSKVRQTEFRGIPFLNFIFKTVKERNKL